MVTHANLVSFALQGDVLLVHLHLHLLHPALQLAVCLLQVVVVSVNTSTNRSHHVEGGRGGFL